MFIRRWDAGRDRADCRERLIRLKPGRLSGDIWIMYSTFIRRWDAGRDRADCRERLIRLKPGRLSGDME
jgi:hypothetical protein